MQRHAFVRAMEAAIHEHHHGGAHVLTCPAAHFAADGGAMVQVFDGVTHADLRKFVPVLLGHGCYTFEGTNSMLVTVIVGVEPAPVSVPVQRSCGALVMAALICGVLRSIGRKISPACGVVERLMGGAPASSDQVEPPSSDRSASNVQALAPLAFCAAV